MKPLKMSSISEVVCEASATADTDSVAVSAAGSSSSSSDQELHLYEPTLSSLATVSVHPV